MTPPTKHSLRIVVCLAATLAIVAIVWGLHVRQDRVLSASLNLFLIAVLFAAIGWGAAYATLLSVLGALGFGLLLPPAGHFHFADARVWTVLAACFVSGLTASGLSGRLRHAIREADERRSDAVAGENRFSELVHSVEGIVWEADADSLEFSFVSDQARKLLGFPAERWLSEPGFWQEHLHPDDRDRAIQFCRQAVEEKRSHDFEYRMIAADGRAVWIRDLVTVARKDGRANRLRGVMIDVTDRKRAEETLQDQAKLLDLTHDGIIVRDMNRITRYWNRGAEELYGWKANEAVGKGIYDLLKTVFPTSIEDVEDEVIRTGRWEGELTHTKKDGTRIVVSSRWSLQRDDRGAPLAVLVTNNDITEQKRAEDIARRSAKELRDVIETIPAVVWSALPDGSNTYVNSRWTEYAGDAQENPGTARRDPVHPEDAERYLGKWETSIVTGAPFEDEVRFRRADGEYHWHLVRGVPLRDEHGQILKWYGVMSDIEDRKRAESLLAGEKRVLEMVARAESLPGILDGLCRLVEQQAKDVLASVLLLDGGRPRHGAAPSLPKDYTDAIDGSAVGPFSSPGGIATDRGRQIIVEDIASDPRWAGYRSVALAHDLRSCWCSPIFSSQGSVIAVFAMYYRQPRGPTRHEQEIVEQITHLAGVAIERQLTYEQLTRSEAILAEAQRLTHTGSWAYGPQRGMYWSEESFRLLGFDPDQPVPDGETVLRRVHPEDRERVREFRENALRSDSGSDQQFRIVLADGSVRHIHTTYHPVFNANGDLVEIVGTHVDVTESKRAEQERERLRELEGAIAHINRVSMMGELAASLAHEIKQPIAAAITSANACLRWLTRDPPDLDRARAAAGRVGQDGTRAAEVINRLQSFYKKGAPDQREAVNINEVIQEMAALLRNEATRYSISIRPQLHEGVPLVTADRVQLQQILMNLMLNAIDAMKDTTGELTVRSGLNENGQVVVSVSDSGVGIALKDADRVFDAFFTTKPQGTGMGLAITRSLVESHGGHVWVTSNAGAGVTFHFTLPASAAEAHA